MVRTAVTLDDKYTEKSGRIYLNGMQALVRIPMMQHMLDVKNGLNTATFISGYRGSPIGALDMAIGRAKHFTEEHKIRFLPGLNEDLGATAVWGSQQLNLSKKAMYDGVVGMWYGKGPGVDRSNDVLKHANAAGSSKYGGVLALAGDDHACKSSTFPHQSEQAFVHCMIPIFNPTGLQDAMELGLHGIAMSRYSGAWSGMKIVSDMADSSASVFSDPFSMKFNIPEDFLMPEDGLNIRWYDKPVDQEERLINFRLPAAKAYARANNINRITMDSKKRRIGIVSTGKAYMDTCQALEELNITPEVAEEMGLSLLKIGLVWPLDEVCIKDFANGLDEILIVEEKRSFVEQQIKEILFNMPADARPRICGKTDENGKPLFPETYELAPTQIAEVIIGRIETITDTTEYQNRLNVLKEHFERRKYISNILRMPYYCSGCPHNTSTVVPEGSRALAGIGCHYMSMWMDRDTYMFSQMGGEGVPWAGQAPFTSEKHVFANLGDGTYFHSGLMAIRASVAAKVNITYKILYNDAVAMTGGQPVDGSLSVPEIANQVRSEGIQTIYIVSDDIEKYKSVNNFPSNVVIKHRDELDRVQKILREVEGCTILIYDQTCAAEKRRRRKRGLMEDPKKRVFINEKVCEGCGDCGKKSNCLSIHPVETEMGRKRKIDQSSCNKDFSCVKGFCPSFVTVEGGDLRKPEAKAVDEKELKAFKDMVEPILPEIKKSTAILVTGIGGTGVVTIGALLAMAAHLEDKGCTTMDQTGLAQKGGAVTSHIRIAKRPEDIQTVRIDAGGADVILGCDLLVTADGDALSKINGKDTKVILNHHITPTGAFTQDPNWNLPQDKMIASIRNICGDDNLVMMDATKIATKLMGNSIASNMFVLGYAWQMGTIPVSKQAIMSAIELNNVAIKMNQEAFEWGRRAAFNLDAVEDMVKTDYSNMDISTMHRKKSKTLEEVAERRAVDLTLYQNAAYAKKYTEFVNEVKKVEANIAPDHQELSNAVARYYYKLMAYKDEYEVARLYSDGSFIKQVQKTFDGNYKLKFHLAPPVFSKRDPDTGHLIKKEFGPSMLKMFGLLAKFKFLRGTALDVFGYSGERKDERRLIKLYKDTMTGVIAKLNEDNHEIAVEIASLPDQLRGFGHVKEANLEKMEKELEKLLEKFNNPAPKSGLDTDENDEKEREEKAA